MIKGNELIELGYPNGPLIGQLVERIAEYQERGICDRKYLLKLLEREFGTPNPKVKMRDRAIGFGKAIEATNKDERANVEAVTGKMNQLLKTPVITGGAIMPDACPAGLGEAVIPVGGAISVENAIIPSAHSADICCSMYASFYEARTEISKEMDALVTSTRFGPGGRHYDHTIDHPVIHEEVWENKFLKGLQDYAKIHMADQGDGNHFSYIGKVTFQKTHVDKLRTSGYAGIADALEASGEEAKEYRVLVTHHGSRGLGAHLYKSGQRAAEKYTHQVAEGVPKAAVWLDYDTEQGQAYWDALQYVSRWTLANHQAIHQRFLDSIGAEAVTSFGNEHNFVWKKERGDGQKPLFLHGKGATPAWKDEAGNPLLGLIPLNMAEPILIILGKDKEECLGFAPHGAGRNLSRTALKKRFYAETRRNDPKAIQVAIDNATEGLDIRWYCGKPDLSESPIAYKNADQVKAQIEQFELAEIVAEIHPLGCIMAGEDEMPYWKRKKERLTPKQKRQIEHRAERRTEKQHLGQMKYEDFNA